MGIVAGGASASGPAPLPGFLNVVVGPLDHYGYAAIALLLLLENIGVPVIPGEFAMIAGAIFAGTGRAGLNIVLVGVISVVAAIVGAEIGYLIGKFAGRELILHHGKYVLIKPHHLDRAEAIVDRYGGIVVIIARYIVGLREANGIIAGIAQMRWLTFTIFNVIGACAWVATWVSLGYLAGDHINSIYSNINKFSLYILLALVVLLAGYVARRLMRRRRHRATAPRTTPGTPEKDEALDDLEADEAQDARTEPDAHAEPDVRAVPDAHSEPDARAVPDAHAEPDARAVPDAHAEPDVRADPEVRAEPDARASGSPGDKSS